MSSNYPAGAEHDPNAPYNLEEYPEREFSVTISVTLTKTDKLNTDNYEVDDDPVEKYVSLNCTEDDWETRYKEQRNTLPMLLDELKRYAEAELKNTTDSSRRAELKDIIADCEGWEVEEVMVEEQ